MNYRLLCKIIGVILMIEAVFMLLPVIVAIICHESDWKAFLITLICSAAVGATLFSIKLKSKKMYAKDGLVTVGLVWIIMSLVGAVPFTLTGTLPNYMDAIFESVSGFTTSGITIYPDVEILSHAILFWRSMLHWIGGMGVLVFMLAISPVVGGSSIQLMKAEAPGPVTEKITPKISQTAKWLYVMYFILTGAQIIALTISGLSVFQSTLFAFSTLGTGGFSCLNSSVIGLTYAQQVIIEVFMFLAGVNFSLYFLVITGKVKRVFKDIELRWYAAILLAGIICMALNLFFIENQYNNLADALHQSAFATLSAMTSTGFAADNYVLWPDFSRAVIMILMFIGGCAGSTAGGIKVSRVVLMAKTIKSYIRKTVFPNEVKSIRYNGKMVSETVVRSIVMYFTIIFLIMGLSVLVVSAEQGISIETAVSTVATSLNNNGIELSAASLCEFWNYHWWTKLTYIIDMLIGRLEIFPVMALFIYLFKPVENLGKRIKRKANY